jgi:hypothetical protein
MLGFLFSGTKTTFQESLIDSVKSRPSEPHRRGNVLHRIRDCQITRRCWSADRMSPHRHTVITATELAAEISAEPGATSCAPDSAGFPLLSLPL